jgi:hypothetical protein
MTHRSRELSQRARYDHTAMSLEGVGLFISLGIQNSISTGDIGIRRPMAHRDTWSNVLPPRVFGPLLSGAVLAHGV